jgi:hypothetical protein
VHTYIFVILAPTLAKPMDISFRVRVRVRVWIHIVDLEMFFC